MVVVNKIVKGEMRQEAIVLKSSEQKTQKTAEAEPKKKNNKAEG